MTAPVDSIAETAVAPPARDASVVVDVPRSIGKIQANDLQDLALPLTSGVTVAVLARYILDWSGILSTVLVAALIGMALVWVVTKERSGPLVALNRVVSAFVWACGAIAIGAIAWMLTFVIQRGAKRFSWSFITNDMAKVGPLDPGGGVFHSIIGTLEQVGIATAISIPLSILTAVYLHEIKGRMSRVIRFIVNAMTGLPSVVSGLIVYSLWVSHHGYSGVAASAALSILMIPTVTRTSEEILRTIPDHYREGALALGAQRWRVTTKVVLPAARAGLLTATILGIARAIGETAPARITALGTKGTNLNPLHDPQSNLPTFVWDQVRSGNTVQIERAWSGALVLVTLVLVLFTSARFVSSRGSQSKGR